MTRWQLENGAANYWARYHAYENYLRDYAKRAGLSETQVSEQLGRYAVGLQDKLQIEPDKLAFGKEVAKKPEYWGTSNTSTAQTLQNTGQQLKTETRNFAGGTVTSYYGGTLEQLRNAEPLGNRAQAAIVKSDFQKALEKTQFFRTTNANSVDRLGKAKQNRIAAELKSLIQSAKTPEEQAIIKDRVAKFRGGNDKKLFNSIIQGIENTTQTQAGSATSVTAVTSTSQGIKTLEGQKAYDAVKSALGKKRTSINAATINSQLPARQLQGAARQSKQNMYERLFGGHSLTAQGKMTEEGQKAYDAVKSALGKKRTSINAATINSQLPARQLQGAARLSKQNMYERLWAELDAKNAASSSTAKKLGAAKGAKSTAGFCTKALNFCKKNKGKLAIAAAVTIGAIWLGSKLLNKNSKVQEQPAEDTSQAATPTLPAEPVTQPENSSSGGASEYNYTVENGDCFWNIAKENIIQKHGGNYTPSNREILEETLKIMEANNYTLDQNGWYSDPILYPGAQLQIEA